MDTAQYFIKCKGKEQGPYRFYQLQQLRTEDQLIEDQFEPEEWNQVVRFIETGELPKSSLAGMQNSAVRKVDPEGGTLAARRPVLVGLTYIGYLVGILFVAGGLLQAESRYLFRSGPMLLLGGLASLALCHTFVHRFLKNRLSEPGENPPSKGRAAALYLGGLVPLLMIIALSAATAEFFLKAGTEGWREVVDIGMKYLAAGAAVSLYLPIYCYHAALDHELKPCKKYSAGWVCAPFAFILVLGLYLAPESVASQPQISAVRERLFVLSGAAVQNRHQWNYPVVIGAKHRNVEKVLGPPDDTVEGALYYRNHDLHISFDSNKRVSKLHFKAGANPDSGQTIRVVSGVTPAMTLREMELALKEPPSAMFSDNETETYVWYDRGFRLSACFWKMEYQGAEAHRRGALKWLEAAAMD